MSLIWVIEEVVVKKSIIPSVGEVRETIRQTPHVIIIMECWSHILTLLRIKAANLLLNFIRRRIPKNPTRYETLRDIACSKIHFIFMNLSTKCKAVKGILNRTPFTWQFFFIENKLNRGFKANNTPVSLCVGNSPNMSNETRFLLP